MPAASPPLPEISAASKDLSPGANGVDVQLRGCGYRSSIGTVPSSLLGPLKKQRKKKPSLAAIPSFSELCLATAWFRGRNTLGPFCRSSNRAAVKLCSNDAKILETFCTSSSEAQHSSKEASAALKGYGPSAARANQLATIAMTREGLQGHSIVWFGK